MTEKKKTFWAGNVYNLQPTINYYYREKNDLTLELADQQEKKKSKLKKLTKASEFFAKARKFL